MGESAEICISQDALDRMMPMHVVIGPDEVITHAGPTLRKICPDQNLIGQHFFDVFEPRRRSCQNNLLETCATPGMKVYLRLRDQFSTQLIGNTSLLPNGGGILMNLSFGISVIDAVGNYDLAGSDFAATDLTLEMLWMFEAKSGALAESSELAGRLYGAKQAAEADAASDELTGLCNRRMLDQVLARLISRKAPFTLMHLDLDFFKTVNDTLGHAAGDYVLKTVSKILTEETREEDTVARVGGDEFVLVFNQKTDRTLLGAIAKRMIRRLEEPIGYRDDIVRVSGSIGMVGSTQYETPDATRMMVDADAALYASKKRGRARYTFFESGMNVDEVSVDTKAG